MVDGYTFGMRLKRTRDVRIFFLDVYYCAHLKSQGYKN